MIKERGSELVKVGIEVGEHVSDYDNFINYIQEKYDISKVDFILIVMKPVEVAERIWLEWAEFFRDTKTFFAFLYTQQRGAPKGKESHLSKDLVSKITGAAGEYFVGDMIGETGGLCSWYEGYYEDHGMEKPAFDNMTQAKESFVRHIGERVAIDRKFEVPAVLSVEAITTYRYNFEAGVDFAFVEMMCGNPEIMFAAARGSVKAYGKKWWGSHIANEWYGGFRNDDPLKYKRLKLAYYYSYFSGASIVYPESGDLGIASYGYNYDGESTFCRMYRSIWSEFADFVHSQPRPKTGPKVKIGFVQGNLDSWAGWGGATVWNRFGNENWEYKDAEYSWNVLEEIYKAEKWHVPTVYGEQDMSTSVPYGIYDIVPAEAPLDVLCEYNCLIFAGWNTMTEEIYKKLEEYVFNGGKLFMTAAHLNTSDKRDGEWYPINGGDLSRLFGCRLNGNDVKLNRGVKFLGESIIPGYKYPTTRNGICDPILAAGSINCVGIDLTDGRVAAILADKFIKWREDSPAIMVEKAYGKGYATLFTAKDYPGSRGMEKLYKTVLKAIFSAEQEAEDLKVMGGDKLYYTVYAGGGKQYTVYMINTDYNNPVNAKVSYNGMESLIKVDSCDVNIAYIQGDFMIIPESKRVYAEEVKENGNGVSIVLRGLGMEENIHIVSTRELKRVLKNGENIPFSTGKNGNVINTNIEQVSEINIETI